MPNYAAISLGSNLGDSASYVEQAITALTKDDNFELLAQSRLYSSKSWGFDSKNDFVNACAVLKTNYTPGRLLEELQRIEIDLGREAKTKSGYEDRTIDLDILFYNRLVLNTARLTIPHPLLHVRNFVLEPLAEIASDWPHPLYLKSIRELLLCSPDKSVVHAL